MAVLCASPSNALDSTPASGDAGGVQKTKPFGKLSLSLSLTLSVPVGKPAPQASTVTASGARPGESTATGKTLSELNAEIAALEEMIRAQQRELDVVVARSSSPGLASPNLVSPHPSSILATPVDTVSSEPTQGDATVGAPEVSNENSRLKINAPNVRPASAGKNGLIELPGMGVLEWGIALIAPLLAASGFLWYRRRQAKHIGKPDKYRVASELHEEPKLMPPPVMSGALSAAVEPEMKIPTEAESLQTQQSILPPEYEMLEEADIYLRFGHDKLAEEALREAIKVNPKNPQAYLTLLRIYFAREDSAAFLALAQQLKSFGDGGIWLRVAEMGRNLDANNPLYR